MQRTWFVVVVAIALYPLPQLRCQLSISRGLFVSAAPDTAKHSGLMSRAELFATIEVARPRVATFQSSDYRLGGIVDVVRLGGTTLGLVLGTELKAAPENSIGFDPRGAMWEEQVALLGRGSRLRWSLAAFMRCRHDIDNGTPVEPPDVPVLIHALGRTIGIPGVQLGAAASEWRLSRRTAIRAAGHVEGYVHPFDQRTPKDLVAPDWGNARGAASLTVRATFALGSAVDLFARQWESHVVFDDPGARVRTNARGEVGVHLHGPASGIDVFFSRERAFDDAMTVDPRPALSSAFGVRLTGPSFF